MADVTVNPTVVPTDTNPTAPAAEVVSTPQTTSGGAPAGGGARPPTPPAAPSTSPERGVDLTDTLEWAPGKAAPLKDLIAAREELERVKASGYDTYQRAMAGDKAAIREWLDKLQGGPTVATPAEPTQPQGAQPAQAPPPGYQEVLEFVNQQRAQQVRTNLQETLKQPAFANLAKRPDAVDYILGQLNALYVSKVALTPQVVSGVIGKLNEIEKKYQDNILEPYKKQIGELGVSDPFRNFTPANPNEPVPGHNDPKRKQWFGQRFREAAAIDTANQAAGQQSVL